MSKIFGVMWIFLTSFGALRGVPAREGSGQDNKAKKILLFGRRIFEATCLGARERLLPLCLKKT